jgi:hypothetical protein
MMTADRFPMEPPDQEWTSNNRAGRSAIPARPEDWRKTKPSAHANRAAPKADIERDPAVADFLSVVKWANLEIGPEHRFLGDFITSATRAFIVGATGIGKTMFMYGMVGGMASGKASSTGNANRPRSGSSSTAKCPRSW